ncbi:MAG: 3'(2'),5'-bisphosphate nucleotidase CysQ [Alphaproteobacteria bacterium]|nr:3'(2'),5'-bisphosphate nucleotidase CysQ [Alphaproteobacteria bacterium]
MPGPDPAFVLDLALIEQTVREAGAIARRYFEGSFKSWDKGRGQPVTEADLAVNRFLHEALRAAQPDYGWLSEESEDDPARLGARDTFVVDPIDGTVAFLKKKPHFTISVAVVREGRPTSGVVLNPITGECFTAVLGGGAKLNGAPIAVSTRENLEGCHMLAGKGLFANPGQGGPAWSEPPFSPWPAMEVETRSSIAYRMALVAGGGFDAMLALSAKHDWDMAAGDLIVREAGGCVTDHRGGSFRYNGPEPVQPSIVCAGPRLHAQLIERLRNVPLSRH